VLFFTACLESGAFVPDHICKVIHRSNCAVRLSLGLEGGSGMEPSKQNLFLETDWSNDGLEYHRLFDFNLEKIERIESKR